METEEFNEIPSGDELSLETSDKEKKEEPIDISPEKTSGIIKTVLRKGHGYIKPANGDKVSVHYTGRLLNGEVFDSSRERNEQFYFTVGKKEVIQGWDIAVTSMLRGEIAEFKLAPEFAYGETGAPPKIGPNETLIFEIELFDWKMEDCTKKKDNGVCKRIIVDGEGYSMPNDGATCEVHLLGKCDNKVFEERNVNLILGEGSEEGVIEGVEIALRRMKKGEKAEVHIQPEYSTCPTPKAELPTQFDKLIYEVTLKNFEKMKESYEMDNSERLEQSELAKVKGTKYFKENKFGLAIKQYKRLVQYLGPPNDFEGEDKIKRDLLILAAHLNLAMSYLKCSEYTEAVKQCDSALEIDPNNEKGLFRRGQARFGQKEYDKAKVDFSAVLALDSNNKAAKNQIIACNNAIKAEVEKERRTYRNMFEKFAKVDEKKAATSQAGNGNFKVEDENKEAKKEENENGLEEVEMIDSKA